MALESSATKIAVRYMSNYGRTKTIAEEIAAELGVEAISVVDEPNLEEYADVLFLGGAPYWSIMDPALEAYAKNLDPALVGTVVLFTTSNWSHRTVIALRKILEDRGFTVEPGHFYVQMTQVEQQKPAAREYARKTTDAIRANMPKRELRIPELAVEFITVGALATGIIVAGAVAIKLLGRFGNE